MSISIKVNSNNVTPLKVSGDGVEAPDLVSLQEGVGVLSRIVNSTNAKFSVSLGGVVSSTWSIGKVNVNPDVLRVTFRDQNTLRILAG
ncbi:MAG: hypothetical protein ACP5KD_07975 [Fervidobacterium sp.]